MVKKLIFICKLLIWIRVFVSGSFSLFAITEVALHTAENIKEELAVLLKQDTAVMTPADYAAWKKKVDDGLAYIIKVYPSAINSYENALTLKEEIHQMAHPLSQETKNVSSSATVAPNSSGLQESVTTFNKGFEKILLIPDQLKVDLQQLKLKPGALPLLFIRWQEVEAVNSLFTELAATGALNTDMQKNFYDKKDFLLKSISNAAGDICNAVLSFALSSTDGFKAQLGLSALLLRIDTLEKLSKEQWPDLQEPISLFLSMNELLQEGCWQENDFLITLLPTMYQDKMAMVKANLNSIINHNKKGDLFTGIYDQLVVNMKNFLQNVDRIVDTQSIEQTTRETLDKHCDVLTDYLACMLECETIILKYQNQKGIEITSVDQYNAEDLIVLLNRIKEKINSHSLRAENAKKKSDIDDLLITFDAASLAMQKVVETFVNPAVDVIPNFDLLYIQISKVHEKYLDLIQAQKVSPQEQDTFLNAYKKVLQSLDTHIIVFANKILSYIESKENLFEINTWLRSLVAAYAKGTKKINTLAVDNEIQFKTYAKLLHVLSDLFVKGVALEGNQSVNLKIIVKRGFVEQRFMTEFENHINTLFNTAKDTNGLIKGLISRAIEFIDNVLLLAQEYMATVDILIVKAYQIQITPVVRLLEELFAMENELVVPELQKFVKRNISAPFSSSTILEDARKLIDPVHAIDFALHVSSTTTGAKATSTVASAGTQEVSSPLMQSIVTLLDEIQSDVHAKLTSMHIPTVVPSFADEYKDMVNAEALYGDTKQEFSKQDRELYKSKTVQVMQSIDAAVMQVALKTALFVCQPGGLFEKQLAYIANVYMSFIQGKSDMFDIVTSAEYNIVLEQAKLLQKLCQEGLAPLKKVSAATLEVGTLKKDVQNLNDFLNSMLNSTLDVKSKNTPTGLCDKLIAKWLKFFEDWKKSVKKSTVAEIQKMQSKLKPAIDLLYCYQEVITVLKTVSQHMPILHTELQNSFIETIKNILDPAQAHAFIEVSVNSDSMQSKQTVAAGGALTVAAKTTPTSPSNTGSTQKTDKVSSESNSVKKVSPTFTVLENFTKLKNDFASAVTRLDLAKGVVPDIQQFFDSVEKGKDSFEFDTALQAVSTEDVAKVEAVYQGLLLFGMQQAFKIGKSALEYGNSSMGLLVKDLLTVLKTYETDSKKIAGMKKDQALKNVCDRIKVFDGLYTKSIFTLSAIKGIKAKGTIDDLDAFLKQLNILVDSTIKNNKYVGLLNQLIDAWQLLFNECLSYMKTLTVDQVITFQQELVYLQDVCVLLDKFVTKTISIVDGERVKIKNGLINSSFSATLQKITKRENAALYAKGSSGESTDVQRALISLSDSGSKKK